jgi:hypothetical protein
MLTTERYRTARAQPPIGTARCLLTVIADAGQSISYYIDLLKGASAPARRRPGAIDSVCRWPVRSHNGRCVCWRVPARWPGHCLRAVGGSPDHGNGVLGVQQLAEANQRRRLQAADPDVPDRGSHPARAGRRGHRHGGVGRSAGLELQAMCSWQAVTRGGCRAKPGLVCQISSARRGSSRRHSLVSGSSACGRHRQA